LSLRSALARCLIREFAIRHHARSHPLARRVAAAINPAHALRALLVAGLFLSAFIADNALISRGVGTRCRSRHAFLSTVLAALILRALQIVFP